MRIAALIGLLLLPLLLSAADSGGGRSKGVPTAPVKIEVYSDFECPACKTLHEQTLRPLINDYVRTGKVYLISRLFPLSGHAHSRPAAYLACAAERIGKFGAVADVLFANQAAWSVNGKVEEVALSVLTPAEAAKVRALAKDPAIAAEVEMDLQLGNKIPVQQTPTLIISHRSGQYPLTGSINYSILRRFIDELLSK
jgi:protein-disulfide isomerase